MDDFQRIVDDWRDRNAARLRAMTTDELRLRYTASRVMRHAADIVALMDVLDDQDTIRALVSYGQALSVMKTDLATLDGDATIERLLEFPRIAEPTSQDEADPAMMDNDEEATTSPPAYLTPPPVFKSNKTWIHGTVDRIERAIRDHLKPIRWTPLAQHFGGLIVDLNKIALPTLLNDPHIVQETLSPETAVTISLLKTGIVPAHTEDVDNVTAWFEDLCLWVDGNEAKELPPEVIRKSATDFGVELLDLAPFPAHEGTD